jgi:hypothetical protein
MNKTPWYIRLASSVGRPAVLIGSLAMGAPAEVELAQEAGFDGFTAYLAPAVLSLYAICAATVATGRRKGDRGWLPSILGAGLALLYAMGAQVTAHLLAAGHISSGPWLITAVSAVPALSCVSLLHLAAVPRHKAVGVNQTETGREGRESDENDTEAPTSDECLASRPKGRSKPSLQALRDAARNLDAVGERVTSSALAKVFGVSDRTGARYLSQLTA